MALASIQQIHSIAPHPDPEVTRLQVAKIFEWPVVVEKDKHKEGELVVFIEIDSVVPERPEFEFMRSRKFRIFNARFKGAASSGLVMPLSILGIEEDWTEGDDVTDILEVKKYERPVDPQMSGDAKGNFPSHLISISDETNLLGCRQGTLDELEGREIYISAKNDGCLDANTILETEDGKKTIKDICESGYSGRVASFDVENGEECFRKITNHFVQSECEDWYEIEMEHGTKIKLTGNHRVWMPELNCYRKAEDLKENDVFLIKM